MITTQLPLPMRCSSDALVQPELELKPTRNPQYVRVEKFFDTLDRSRVVSYTNYWNSIAPKGTQDSMLRWLFAFMSVHTSWKSNVNGYNAIKTMDWWHDQQILLNKLKHSGVGLHNNRTKFVWAFQEKFWNDVEKYSHAPADWRSHRDELVGEVLGLGRAKVSFSLEMMHPDKCEVVCMDTHMFQAYGLDQTKDEKHYNNIEAHWIAMCRAYDVPCYIARCLYWDAIQDKQDSRYWSYVFEE